jgi:hypothetical protein
VNPAKRVRLCMKDLFHQDVVEMIERETRQFEVWDVEDPADPQFQVAYDLLWEAFGPQGEMEREDAIRRFLLDDPYDPTPAGTYIKYFLLVARDKRGNILGVRDGTVMVNQQYDEDLCVVYLSHIYMRPEARGTVLSYWLRIAPVEIAVQYLAELHQRGKIALPLPDQPGRNYGMRLNLAAEMEYFDPADRISWQRILFYGRGGFDAINPRHFPYMQPDFRDHDQIRATGNRPMPFMILLRRMGRERQATLPIDEAQGVMRLLYDDFAYHCAPEFLENSLQVVLDRLEERAKRKHFVELLPLPTGPKNIGRLKRLFRYTVFQRYYRGLSPVVEDYILSGVRQRVSEPGYLDRELSAIAAELEKRPAYVYPSRDKAVTWDDQPSADALPGDGDVTVEVPRG